MHTMIRTLIARVLSPGQNVHSSAMSIFAIRVAGAGIAYISQILLARWISPHDNGVYVQYISVISIALALIVFGFESSPQYFIPNYKKTHDAARVNGLIAAARYFSLGISVLITLTAALFTQIIPMSKDMQYAVILTAALSIPWSLMEAQGGIARCWNWMKLAIAPSYLLRFLFLGVIAVFGIRFDPGANYVDALSATLIATCIACVLQTFILQRKLKYEIRTIQKTYEWQEWFRYNASVTISNICALIIMFSDVLILGRFAIPEDVAVYYIASKTIIIANFILYSVGVAYSHRFAEASASQNASLLQNLMHSATRVAFWPTFAASACLVIMGQFILSLFGGVYTQGYVFMVLLAIVPIIRASIGPADRLMLMAKMQRHYAVNQIWVLAITVGLQFIMGWYYGAFGIAIATIAACVFETLLFRASIKKHLNIECFFGAGVLGRLMPAPKLLHLEQITPDVQIQIPADNLIPNVFYDQASIRAMAKAMPALAQNSWIYRHTNANDPLASGMLPIHLSSILGLTRLRNITHPLSALGSPQASASYMKQFMAGLFEQAKQQWKVNYISLRDLPDEHSLLENILRACQHTRGTVVFRRHYKRAILDTTLMEYEDYVQTSLSGGRRKKLRSYERRLNELHPVHYTVSSGVQEVATALEEFAQLEAQGWKGRAGTALLLRSSDQSFMKHFVHDLSLQSRVQIFALRTADKPIAMGIVLYSEPTAYFFKICYDESYAKFSPGVLLTMAITRQMFKLPHITSVDACSDPNHPMIDHLWSERRHMVDIAISLHQPYDPRTWMAWGLVNGSYYGRHYAKAALKKAKGLKKSLKKPAKKSDTETD